MNQAEKTGRFFVARNAMDRRTSGNVPPPYFTEEGMVLVDRRERPDRRAERLAEAASKIAYLVPGIAA